MGFEFKYSATQSGKGSIGSQVKNAKSLYQKGQQMFSWAEVVKHDKQHDCWVVVHGLVYNLTSFIEKHPGGHGILDGAGGDMTEIWEMNHPSYMTKAGPPKRFLIGKIRDYRPLNNWDGDFYHNLKIKLEEAIPVEERKYNLW